MAREKGIEKQNRTLTYSKLSSGSRKRQPNQIDRLIKAVQKAVAEKVTEHETKNNSRLRSPRLKAFQPLSNERRCAGVKKREKEKGRKNRVEIEMAASRVKRQRRRSMAQPIKTSAPKPLLFTTGFVKKKINTLRDFLCKREGNNSLGYIQGLSATKEEKANLGSVYRLATRYGKFKRGFKKALKVLATCSWKISYRSAIASLILFLIYSSSPGVLSAPQSETVTTKAQWDLGTLTDVTTETHGSNIDSIQLAPTGTWQARTWAPPPDNISFGHSAVTAGNYLYVFRGYSDNAFWRYDTVNNVWEELEDLPQPAHYGADLSYIQSENKIYAMFGGYSQKFYSYDLGTMRWSQLENLPDTPYTGAAMETDGTDLYVTRGNATITFWKYDVSENRWSNLDPVPSSATVSTGGDLVNGQDGHLYLIRGGNTANFYRYDLTTRDWETSVASLPTNQCSGATCAINGEQRGTYWTDGTTKYLYFFRSNATAHFLRYQINGAGADTWTVLSASEAIPGTTNYTSLNLNPNDGNIYAIRGNGTQDIWKFNPAAVVGQQWVGPKQVQDGSGNLLTVGTGSDLIWDGADYVYAVRGGNTNGVYRYQLSTNAWTNCTAFSGYNINNDVKGTYNAGNIYYLRPGNTNVYYSNCATAWATMANLLPGAPGEGGSIVYNSSDSRYYVLRGGGTTNLYYSTGGVWSTAANMSVNNADTTVSNYYANVGARMVSNGSNLYVMVGDGETSFLRYNTGANNWSKLASTPFAQYYGTDMTYNSSNGKIYALAGYYKDETWEYDIATDSWRKLPDNLKYTFGRGPYNGASVEYTGGTSFYATTGQALTDMWSFTAGATNYESSGTYVSQAIDLADVASWVSLTATYNKPTNTTITYETMTSADNITWPGIWDAVNLVSENGTTYTGTITSAQARYVKVKITLSTSDGASTPTVSDYTISYTTDDEKPTNPAAVIGSSQQAGGTALSSGQQYNFDHPYFTWSGAGHNGTGIAGYYVCFAKDAACTDPETDGIYQTASTYLVNEAMEFDSGESFGTYHLKIKTKDNNGNVASSVLDAFTYIYVGVSPSLSQPVTSQANFDQGTLSGISSTAVADSIRLESASGFWNQTRVSLEPAAVYQGAELALGSCQGSSNHCLYTTRGNSASPYNQFQYYTIETDTWGTRAITPAAVGVGATLTEGSTGFLYAVRGGGNSDFWMYDIANDSWTVLDSVPAAVTYGANISYDGSRYVYLMPGNDDAFYRYDTCNGQGGGCTLGWDTLASSNFANPNTVDGQRVYEGSDSVYDGRNNIFVTQGNYYPYIAKYSVATDATRSETANTWTPMTQAPVGFYNGGALAYDDETNSIFALAGNARLKFFKYDIDADSWTELPDAPVTISWGASMSIHDGYIYIQRGSNTTNFYRYNIEENSWELPTRGFFGPIRQDGGNYFAYGAGSYMTDDESGNLFIIRGLYDNAFGHYDVSTGTYTELARLPVGAYTGANIVYNEDQGSQGSIYYVPGAIRTTRTSYNNYFYKYDIATNIWTELTGSSRPPGQTYAGSSMVYDGTRYIYLTQGNNTANWWRFDTTNNTWSSALPASGWDQRDGARMVYKSGYIYTLRGNGFATFFRCDVSLLPGANCWSAIANNVPANIAAGGSLMDGGDGYLYAIRGGNTNNYYRWPITGGVWETTPTIPVVPGQVTTGGSATNLSNRNWLIPAQGTNTYYDALYSYVVGSSANGTGFQKTGTYTSAALDLTSVYRWANLTTNYTLPANTYLSFQTRTSDDTTACEDGLCDNKEWSSWTALTNDHNSGTQHRLTINSSPARYIQVRINFTSQDRIFSPKVDDFTINYYQDIEAPANPNVVNAYSNSSMGASINSGTWYSHSAPHFVWPAEGEAGGAADNAGGSDVAGYYVCFGVAADCVDPYTDGEFQTGTSYTASALTSGETYYLKIKAIDNAEMIPAATYSAFTYQYDATAPTNPTTMSVTPAGFTSSDNYTFTWTNDASDAHSNILKYQYRTGGDETGVWYDITDTAAVSIALPNVNHLDGAYQSNKNVFYFRVVDNAGNISTPMSQDYYFSGDAPTPPRNLAVDPESSSSNSFTFTWEQPESFSGDASKIKYRYSINALPTAFNTVETTATAAGPGPFATQKGSNNFYVVAVDEANNVDYDLYADVEFFADTAAPGVPGNVQIFDTSDRETQEYSVAVKWSAPAGLDLGNFAGYVIYRSEDNVTFTEVATTTGSAYVDTELESKLYYYYVKSKDKTNNYSIASTTVNIIPTGRYTRPPTIVTQPAVEVQSFAATIVWSTNRSASSFIEYGTTTKLGETNGQVDEVTAHTVELKGLDAGTKYYYRAKFIDPDGNIGNSTIETFETLPPPTISDVKITDVGLHSAMIHWTTNTNAKCTTHYGISSYSNIIEESASGTTHVTMLENLDTSTTYRFQITAIDDDENEFSSDEYTLTTLDQASVSELTVQNKDNVDLPTVEVNYKTSHATTTLIKYKTASESSYHNFLNSEQVTEHAAVIEGLDPAVEYELIAMGIDMNGIEAVSQTINITTLSDSRPPGVLINRAVGKVVGRGKEAKANMFVKLETDELSTVKVLFGKGIILNNFEQSTAEDPANTYHMITIPAEPGQVYSYVVEVKDPAYNKTVTKPVTVVVESAKENATEIVVNTFSSKFGWLSNVWK